MFCHKCGAQLDEGSKFCDQCGAPVSETDNSAVSTINKTECNDEKIGEISEGIPEYQPSDNSINVKPKTGIIKKVVIGIIAVVVAGAICVSAAPYISNFAVKTFSPAKKYYSYVEKKSVGEGINGVGEGVSEFGKDSYGINGKYEVEIGDLSAFNSVPGFSELTDIIGDAKTGTIEFDAKANGKLIGVKASGKINKTPIADLEVIANTEDEELYLGFPSLSKQYISKDIYSGDFSAQDIFTVTEALPDARTVKSLLNKYVALAVSNASDVSKSSDSIEIDGITEKCTVLDVTVDEKFAEDAAEAVLKEAKNDKKLKKMILDYAEKTEDILNISTEDIESQYEDSIDEALDNISFGTFEIGYKVYVNSKGEIIGREIDTDDFSLSMMSAQKGTKYAFEVSAESDGITYFTLEGNGKKRGQLFSGKVKVKVAGQEVAGVDLKNFNFDIENCAVKGTGTINTGKNISRLLGYSGADSKYASILSSVTLKFDIDSSLHNINAGLGLYQGENKIVSVKYSIKDSSGYKPSVPKDSVYGDDDDALEEFIKDIDVGKIIDNLENVGISSDVCNSMREELPE